MVLLSLAAANIYGYWHTDLIAALRMNKIINFVFDKIM